MAHQKDQTLTDEEIHVIRAEVRQVLAVDNLSQADAARESGVAYATFSGWLNGSYSGRNDRVAAELKIWLVSRQERKTARSALPTAPEFVRTKTAAQIHEVLQWAQIGPDIVVIAGGAGIGKTTSCVAYAASNSNVWIATMQPSTSKVNTMLQAIAVAVGVTERSPAKLGRSVGDRVQNTGGLIIVDEAQHLDSKSLDQLRSLHDLHGIGVALAGNESVYSRLEGEGRKPEFAQLFSRIGMRFTRPKPATTDVCDLIAAWAVTDKDALPYLKAIAQKPGALRMMTKVLRLASMLAGGNSEELALSHIRAAWEKLSSNGGAS